VALGDIQPVYAKALDAQALMQPLVALPDLLTRQAERNLARERLRQESQVEEEGEASETGGADPDIGKRLPKEKLLRYRLAWRPGQGMALEAAPQGFEFSRRLDINI
jgi:hypothetical protein